MGYGLDFRGMDKCEHAIQRTWDEFRLSLARGRFTYQEIERAKEETFLHTYDDLFNKNLGIKHQTIMLKDLSQNVIGRGTKLRAGETPNYERFIPKAEYISEDNRFSPPGIEWLYLAIGEESSIHECSQHECRAKSGDRFGFCHFTFDSKYDDCKIVNLTISDDLAYMDLNRWLEEYAQEQIQRGIAYTQKHGRLPQKLYSEKEFRYKFTQWSVFTYAKLLSEQIFVPLSMSDDKRIMYAPFQTMAQYYISLGYSGIIYGSTVCPTGKNLVLFDKEMAHPTGVIEDYQISCNLKCPI